MAASRRPSPFRPSIRLSTIHSGENSRSASPERTRESLYPDIDPLLSNLSPESTLQALTSTGTVPSNGTFSHDVLSQSISQVSPSERALGIRAAIAARNLDLWLKEVKSWTWPNTADAKVGKGFVPPVHVSGGDHSSESSSLLAPSSCVEYYGSLPAEVVEEHEKRIEEIRDGVDGLDVEELKEHVLNAHIPSRSRPSSSTSTVSVPPPLSYVQLSDFTAIVTATILRALPCLSRLSYLLSTWDVRLLVLRQIPGLLKELQTTRSILDASNHALRSSYTSEDLEGRLSSSFLRDEHFKVEGKVIDAGRRMDCVLDALEGRQDSLPEQWIDDLESIEADFAAWVVEAERYKLRTEWLHSKRQAELAEANQESEAQLQAAEKERENESDTKPEIPETIPPVAPMETIDEEPAKSQPEQSIEQVPEQADIHTSIIFTDSDSLSQISDPDTSYNPIESELHTSEESKDNSEGQSNIVVAEDIQTPTQEEFPQEVLTETPDVQSPARIPLPMTPDIENKENIPPQGLLPPRSPSVRESPVAKPVALAEHVDDDPFIQRPSTSQKLEQVGEPEIPVGGGMPMDKEEKTAVRGLGLKDRSRPNSTQEASNETAISNSDQPITGTEQLPLVQNSPSITQEAQGNTFLETPILMSQPPVETPDRDNQLSDSPASSTSPTSENALSISPEPQAAATTSQLPSSNKPTSEKEKSSKKKPLQSPIKLSKSLSGKLSIDKAAPRPRSRRQSIGSEGSLVSDDSISSSPGVPGPYIGSSSGQNIVPHHRQEYTKSPSRGTHMLREDRLRRLERSKGSIRSADFQQTRSVSLPLQRFINEKLDLDMTSPPVPEIPEHFKTMKHSAPAHHMDVSTPTPQDPRIPKRRPALARKSSSDLKKKDPLPNPPERSLPAFGGNTARRAMQHQDQPKSIRLRQRLTAHPSLEGLGLRRQELAYVEEDASEHVDSGSRSSSPNKKRPRDQLDEKINSILSTLPGRIHLVDPNNEADTSSSSSSLDRKMQERCLSESPNGPPSRSITPAPSLTLMPAARRRLSHAHKTEDSYVKLYHLHHGGQTAPTKLFVRTVGEDGQRVMVRVGGGWADLGEYLREYVIHHGRRKVSETPRVEVQGLASRSPSGHSPGSLLPPSASPYITSGRATPSRPASVLSARPPSSLHVRKTRRGSTASEAVPPRSITASNLGFFTSPPSAGLPGRRRLSVSSSYSFAGDILSPPTSHAPSNDNSAPLGLAGPKPRSRQISMSPEGEAWVENVLQKTRRSTSFNPPPFGLNTSPKTNEVGSPHLPEDDPSGRSIPKVRSVNDIRSAGSSRRVSLRGLGSHR